MQRLQLETNILGRGRCECDREEGVRLDAPAVDELLQQGQDLPGGFLIVGESCFVDHEHVGVGDEGPRERQQVPLGEGQHLVPRELLVVGDRVRQQGFGHAEAAADRQHALAVPVGVALRHAQREVVVEGAVEEGGVLADVQHAQVPGNEVAALAVHLRQHHASEDPRQGRLAAPAGPDEGHELPLLDAEAPLQRHVDGPHDRAVGAADAVEASDVLDDDRQLVRAQPEGHELQVALL
mmetsp:Transcript_61253/g.177638  ORF Transcript_61253/g.177638 Transcript_61253/m.177638 type:complete len:238 (-) Transcript_61253:2101-2814(-)